jgi:hypothetical protein
MLWKRFPGVVLFFFLALFLWPEPLQVDYLDGLLETRFSGGWQEVSIGETIHPGASLRLATGTVAELSWGSFCFTLIGEGLFFADSLIDSARAVRAWDIRPLVSRKLEALVEGLPEREVSAMGARAAEVDATPGFGWVDDTEAAVAKGKELLAAGKYQEALVLFQEELPMAIGEEEDILRYYAGYAHAGMNQDRQALSELNRIDPDDTAVYYADFVLLRGRLLLEANRFPQALELLDGYLATYPLGGAAQEAAYLSAFGSFILGDREAALGKLERALNLDPDSELGRAAGELRAELTGS